MVRVQKNQSAGHGTSGLDRRRWGASSSHSLERVSSLSASTGAIAEHGQGVRPSFTSLFGRSWLNTATTAKVEADSTSGVRELGATCNASRSRPSFRCHYQSDPRGHRFVLRVSGQAGCRDGNQQVAPLRGEESVQAVPAPPQPDTVLAPHGRSGSRDQASTSGVLVCRGSIPTRCVHKAA